MVFFFIIRIFSKSNICNPCNGYIFFRLIDFYLLHIFLLGNNLSFSSLLGILDNLPFHTSSYNYLLGNQDLIRRNIKLGSWIRDHRTLKISPDCKTPKNWKYGRFCIFLSQSSYPENPDLTGLLLLLSFIRRDIIFIANPGIGISIVFC